MGLMDILSSVQIGPRGGAGRASGAVMSAETVALLGLLAYKAVKAFSGSSADPASPAAANPAVGNAASGAPGLADLLHRVLDGQGSGGLSTGAGGLGGLLIGGLGDLIDQFNGAGKGDAARSWVGTGKNEPISPRDLSQVLTSEQIDFLTRRTGLSREQLLAGLSEKLPSVVDGLTPAGRLPTTDEMDRVVSLFQAPGG